MAVGLAAFQKGRSVPAYDAPSKVTAEQRLRLFDLTGVPGQPAEPCTPDLVIKDALLLNNYGLPGGRVLHTPGHTAGSVSALLANGDVLAGDLAIGGVSVLGGLAHLGHARKPPYEDDPMEVRRSLERLLSSGARRFFVGHGGPLTAASVEAYIRREPRLKPNSRKSLGPR